MQQQPLAFTLVKTVVSARDEGKVLSPALATAWDLLRTELSPAHRVIASEVKWAPTHQDDLRFVIEGVRKQFDKDPDLEDEFLAFLAEVEPFEEDDNDRSILPVVIGITSGSSIPPPVGDLEFVFSGDDILAEHGVAIEHASLSEELMQDSGFAKEGSSSAPMEAESANLVEASVEQHIEATRIEKVLEEVPTIEEATQIEVPAAEPKDFQPVTNSVSHTTSILKYWPLAAIGFLVTLIGLGIWFFSDSKEVQLKEQTEIESVAPTDSSAENAAEEMLIEDPSLEYSAPSIARLSQSIDSLRLAGDYAAALAQQQTLANRLEADESPAQETAQAYSELAILHSTQENIMQAIVEQRKSLGFARKAFAKTDPALGRSHLKLASFYTESGELHMARAHLQQARQVFGQAQELVSPNDQKKTDQLAKRIEEAS